MGPLSFGVRLGCWAVGEEGYTCYQGLIVVVDLRAIGTENSALGV